MLPTLEKCLLGPRAYLGRESFLAWLSCIEMDLRQLEYVVAVATS